MIAAFACVVLQRMGGSIPATSPLSHDLFGVCIASAGDIDGDSVPDLWVGDASIGAPSDATSGSLWCVSGKTGKRLKRIGCPDGAHEFGWTLAVVGDVDGDGIPDVAAGSLFVSTKETPDRRYAFGDTSPLGEGAVFAFSGASGNLLRRWPGPADDVKIPWFSAGAGPSLAGVGDWNGDGVADVAIGWCFADAPGGKTPDCGRVEVVSGKDGTVLHSWMGIEAHGRFGFCVTALPDLDGDGRRDLAASAMPDYGDPVAGADPKLGQLRPGYVLVLSSKGEILHRLSSPEKSRRFGFSLATLKGSTGAADLVVSQCHADSADSCVWLVNASRGAIVQQIPRTNEEDWNGNWPGKGVSPPPSRSVESFGSRVLGVRDFDGDGLEDLLVTMPQSFCSYPAVVLSRKTGSVLATIDISKQPFQWSHIGNAACDLGDVDGDGVPDFAIAGASMRCGTDCDGAVVQCSGKDASVLRVVLRRDLNP